MFIVNELQYLKFLVQYLLFFSSFFLNKKMWVHGSSIIRGFWEPLGSYFVRFKIYCVIFVPINTKYGNNKYLAK